MMHAPLPPRDQWLTVLNGHGRRLTYRLSQLREHPPALAPFQRTVLRSTIEDIEAAYEEVQVASEELCLQGEELAGVYAELEAARRHYQDLFDFAPDAYLVTDTRGVVQEASHAVSAIAGYARGYVIGKPLISLVHPASTEHFLTKLHALLPKPGDWVQEFETVLRPRRKGPPVDVSVRVAPVRDAAGEVSGFRWSFRDITENKALVATITAQERQHSQSLRTRTMEIEAVVRMQAAEIASLRAEIQHLRGGVAQAGG
jgi:PAS domain S-box-containing protein